MARQTNNKAQAMIAVFIYVSVVAFIAVYITTYAQGLHRQVTLNINYHKALYAAEGALIWDMADIRRIQAAGGTPVARTLTGDFPNLAYTPTNSLFYPQQFRVRVVRTQIAVAGSTNNFQIVATAEYPTGI